MSAVNMREACSLLPCATCPWRIEKGSETIPAYSQDAALALRSTVGDGDGLRPIMACHHSTTDKPISCRGYLAQVGWTNINVRIFLAKGKIPRLDRIVEACTKAGIKLHRDYGQMMDKLTMSYERERADLIRIYAETSEQERNEKAEAQRLSKARVNLKRRMDEIELGNEETYE